MFAWVKARLWPALRAAGCNWSRDDGFLHSAALAYYASASLFPICLVLFAGLGYLSEISPEFQDQQGELLAMVERNASPWLADQLRQMLIGIKTHAGVEGPLGLMTLLVMPSADRNNIFLAFPVPLVMIKWWRGNVRASRECS